MRFSTLWCAALLALSGCGQEVETPPAPINHASSWPVVDQAVLSASEIHAGKAILLVGDSITLGNPITTLCGLPVIRAGYGGATWQEIAERPVWDHVSGKVAVVMAGTNNAYRNIPVTQSEMQGFLEKVHAIQIIVETPPPTFSGAVNKIMLEEIQTTVMGLPEQRIDNQDLNNPAFFVADGIHLNEAGYQVQNALLEVAVCGWIQ